MEMVHFEEGGGINGAEGSRGDMMSHRLFEGMLVGEIEDGVKRRMSFGELGCGSNERQFGEGWEEGWVYERYHVPHGSTIHYLDEARGSPVWV